LLLALIFVPQTAVGGTC